MKFTSRQNHYQICLEEKLDERWLHWFEGLEVITSAKDQTLIQGEFDQSALHGVFNRIRDLGVTLISVQRYSDKKDILIEKLERPILQNNERKGDLS